MKPLNDYVAIEVDKVQEEGYKITDSGLYLPGEKEAKKLKKESARGGQIAIRDEGQYMRVGEVKAVGKEVKELKEGDEVTFNRHNGYEVDTEEEGKQMYFLKEIDISMYAR